MRGYFGVAIYRPKFEVNVGSLWRTAKILGATFIITIEKRYRKQPSDTINAYKHIPLMHFEYFEDFANWKPQEATLVGCELQENAIDLKHFHHPQQAIYLLGAEDDGLPNEVMNRCDCMVKLKGEYSLNVAVAGSIILYHRILQLDK